MTNQELELRTKILQLVAELEYYTAIIDGYTDLKNRNNGKWPNESYRINFDAINMAYIEKSEEQEQLTAMLYDLTH